MEKLTRLCNAIRAITPVGALHLEGLQPDENGKELWRGSVRVSDIILVEAIGSLDEVALELAQKLERMSQRMLARLSIVPEKP